MKLRRVLPLIIGFVFVPAAFMLTVGILMLVFGSAARDYIFGGKIAGHTLGEFPHLTWPGPREHTRIYPDNPTRLSDPDHEGRKRYWIVEVHLVAPDRSFGGFYERLLRP